MTDPISRRDAKGDDLLKRDDVLVAVHGAAAEVLGVTAIRSRVGYAIEDAIDKLPALDADGRWEKLRAYIKQLAGENVDNVRPDYFDATEDILAEMAELDGITWEQHMEQHRQDAPPAAERRPAVERQYDEHGQPVCNHCNAKTNRAYAKFAKIRCWSCGRYLPDLTSGDAAQPGK